MTGFFLFADIEDLGLIVGTAGLALNAFVVLIALVCNAFQSWRAVLIGVVGAVIASLAVVGAYTEFVMYRDPSNLFISVPNLLLATGVQLIFVWATPFIQFFIIRGKPQETHRALGQWRPRMAIIPCLAVAIFQGCIGWSIVLKGGASGGTDAAILWGLVITAQFLTFWLFARPTES